MKTIIEEGDYVRRKNPHFSKPTMMLVKEVDLNKQRAKCLKLEPFSISPESSWFSLDDIEVIIKKHTFHK